jgi:hypothetical protein
MEPTTEMADPGERFTDTPDAPGPMVRHPFDTLAFLFALLFLAAAALAFAVQGGAILGDDPGGGAWVLATVLITGGVVAVAGTVTSALRR